MFSAGRAATVPCGKSAGKLEATELLTNELVDIELVDIELVDSELVDSELVLVDSELLLSSPAEELEELLDRLDETPDDDEPSSAE